MNDSFLMLFIKSVLMHFRLITFICKLECFYQFYTSNVSECIFIMYLLFEECNDSQYNDTWLNGTQNLDTEENDNQQNDN